MAHNRARGASQVALEDICLDADGTLQTIKSVFESFVRCLPHMNLPHMASQCRSKD